MQIITDGATITRYRQAKQTNEQELAERLYKTFNSGMALTKLRTVVGLALNEMVEGRYDPDPFVDRINRVKALSEENSLAVWTNHGNAGAGEFSLARINAEFNGPRKAANYSASDCADLIRLIGCWVEKVGGDLNAVKKAYRPGVLPFPAAHGGPAGWAMLRAEVARRAVWRTQGEAAPRDRGRPGAAFLTSKTTFVPLGGVEQRMPWRACASNGRGDKTIRSRLIVFLA